MKLSEKVAIVTGGGSGIGRSICLLFASEGAKVVVADFDETCANQTRMEIINHGAEAVAFLVDVQDESQVQKLVEKTLDTYGRLDILVNSAGILGPMSIRVENLTIEDWVRTIGINLIGSALMSKHAISAMLRSGGGSIINLASTAGLNPIDGAGPYCVSKAGVLMLTRVTALEYGENGIRVNAICPDKIDTPMMRAVVNHLEDIGVSNARANIASGTVLNRFGRPEEVATLALFLASEQDSSFVTGASILVDGGSTCK